MTAVRAMGWQTRERAGGAARQEVLVVSRDERLLATLRACAAQYGFVLHAARSEVEGIVQAHLTVPDAVYLDGRIDVQPDLFPAASALHFLSGPGRTPDLGPAAAMLARRHGEVAPSFRRFSPRRFGAFSLVILALTALAMYEIAQGIARVDLTQYGTFWGSVLVLCAGLSHLRAAHVQRAGLAFAMLAISLAAAPYLGIRLLAG